jgi:hypothetical protein
MLDGTQAPDKAAAPSLSRVNEAVATLYGAVGQASAAPTSAQENASKATTQEFDHVMKVWNEFKMTDVSAVNAQLRSAGHAEIRVDAKPKMEEASPNEE